MPLRNVELNQEMRSIGVSDVLDPEPFHLLQNVMVFHHRRRNNVVDLHDFKGKCVGTLLILWSGSIVSKGPMSCVPRRNV